MIRHATPEDAPAIAAVQIRSWQAAYAGIVPADYLANMSLPKRTEFWRKELAQGRCVMAVAIEDGEVVGWASGGISRDVDAKGESEVYAIYISPDFWTRGIGRRLMGWMEEELPPCLSVTLWVLAENQRGLGFYRKIGYEFDGEEKTIQLGGADLREIRLRKHCQSLRSSV